MEINGQLTLNKKFIVESVGNIALQDGDYLASGGQADVYVKDKMAYKIYHNPTSIIPLSKIEELKRIKAKNVLTPEHVIYDSSNNPVGYTMEFRKNAFPICKLFTNSFKSKNNISVEMVNEFIEKMVETTKRIHSANCLIVDFNELNVLSLSSVKTPYFIDTDSYQTPSHKASAIMESIRDRKVLKQQWTEESDWYSFAILAFQMWIGIHPYKGGHPDYKPKDWQQRMDDGISVFDKKATLPRACNDFSVIPPSFLGWFKDLFVNNNRSEPPSFDESVSIIMPSVPTVQPENNVLFNVQEENSYEETIKSIFEFRGVTYYVGERSVYKGKTKMPVVLEGGKTFLCICGSCLDPVVCTQSGDKIKFHELTGNYIGEMIAEDMMKRNGCVYTILGNRLVENSFSKFSQLNKYTHIVRHAGNVLPNATNLFDGIVFQNIVGKIHAMIPYEKGKMADIHIDCLDGHRILDASCRGNICIVLAEKEGSYVRFYITFKDNFSKYEASKKDNVSYSAVNLVVMSNGVCVLATEFDAEIFKGDNIRVVSNPPFSPDTPMTNVGGKLHYIEDTKVYSASMK